MATTIDTDKAAFAARLKEFEGKEAGEPEQGADPVNQPMIRHWVEAVGDEDPIYTQPEAAEKSVHGEIVAPPVMLQAWVMRGVRPRPTGGGNARDELRQIAPGVWLGRSYDAATGHAKTWFVLVGR